MTDKRSPDFARRSERSRRAIHDAALALVGEVGYRATTIEGHRRTGGRRPLPLTHAYAVVDHALRGLEEP